MGNLISAADVFVDRDIMRFAEGEPVSDLEGEIIAAFLNVKPPPLTKMADLLGEGKYGEVADLMAEVWAVQFRKPLREALTTQLQLAGHAAARDLGDDGFGVEKMLTAAREVTQDYTRLREVTQNYVPHAFAAPALVDPTFDPTAPKVATWIEGRVGAVLGSLEDDAREAISIAISRGAAEELTERQVARVIAQHVGLDQRRAIAVENYRKWVYEFRGRADMERVVKKRPKTVRERLQRGGFKRKEWKIIREHGAKKHLTDRRLDNMVNEYAERLRKERALAIARTETAMAQSRGKEFAWEEAQANGALLPGAMRRWITRLDERVCQHCGPMHGKLAEIGGVWHTSKGDVSTPNEIHTTCRCTEELVATPAKPKTPRRRKPRKKVAPAKKKPPKKKARPKKKVAKRPRIGPSKKKKKG